MSTLDTLLWVVFPYVCLAVFVLGHVWRYRYDKFGWTTRSSQLYEKRLLRLGSPLFHFGLLFVIVGVLIVVAGIALVLWTRRRRGGDGGGRRGGEKDDEHSTEPVGEAW